MRQRRSQPAGDVDWVDVTLVEGEPEDEYLTLLHELALEAIALRTAWLGNTPSAISPDLEQPGASDGHRHVWRLRGGPATR